MNKADITDFEQPLTRARLRSILQCFAYSIDRPMLPNIERHSFGSALIRLLLSSIPSAVSTADFVFPRRAKCSRLHQPKHQTPTRAGRQQQRANAIRNQLTDSKRHKVHMYILPRPRWRSIHFMHDAQMRMLVHGAIPPVPSLAMGRAAGECV